MTAEIAVINQEAVALAEIPMLSPEESAMLLDLVDALEREQEVAETVAQRTADVRSALVAALATSAVALPRRDIGSER